MVTRSRRGVGSALLSLLLFASLAGCVEKVPSDLVESIESLDRSLVEAQGAGYAPEAYARFINHWVVLKGRLKAGTGQIRWPWKRHALLMELQQVRAEGEEAMAQARARRHGQRLEAAARLTALQARLELLQAGIARMGGRIVLGHKPVETALLLHQARTFFDQGVYPRSLQMAAQAERSMTAQAAQLRRELGHYADERRLASWRRLAERTVGESKRNHTVAIVVSKADRELTVYRSGRPVLSYPVRLGYNGLLEKRYQGDGATPEGIYRVIRKRDLGETQFYRAFLLDYPNADDRRRFVQARQAGRSPRGSFIGGQIEIHGGGNDRLSETLGCVQLDNSHINALFPDVVVGTPVTIVGALSRSNTVARALADLQEITEEGSMGNRRPIVSHEEARSH